MSIPVILIVDSSTGNKNEEDVIQAFNELYDGKWQADVEWVMETEEEYQAEPETAECDGYHSRSYYGSSGCFPLSIIR